MFTIPEVFSVFESAHRGTRLWIQTGIACDEPAEFQILQNFRETPAGDRTTHDDNQFVVAVKKEDEKMKFFAKRNNVIGHPQVQEART